MADPTDRPSEEPTEGKPAASEANRQPAKGDDSVVGIGDQAIDTGDAQSAEELKEKNDADPAV